MSTTECVVKVVEIVCGTVGGLAGLYFLHRLFKDLR